MRNVDIDLRRANQFAFHEDSLFLRSKPHSKILAQGITRGAGEVRAIDDCRLVVRVLDWAKVRLNTDGYGAVIVSIGKLSLGHFHSLPIFAIDRQLGLALNAWTAGWRV